MQNIRTHTYIPSEHTCKKHKYLLLMFHGRSANRRAYNKFKEKIENNRKYSSWTSVLKM